MNLKQIPILNKEGQVIDIFLLDELTKPKFLSNDVIIMAGGKGKRLGDLTRDCPKPTLKINSKPILEIILEQCIKQGFQNFYFSVNYLKEQIQDYFKDGNNWNVQIHYLVENEPLGTAGALGLLPKIPNEPFFVLNADVLTKVNYISLLNSHKNNSADISVGIRKHITKISYGIVTVDNSNLLSIEEKPVLTHFINSGIYVLEPNVLSYVLKNKHLDMPSLIMLAKKNKNKVNAFLIHEYWKDIGNYYEYEESKEYFMDY